MRGGLILREHMKYYGKYRGELGSANAQQVINKNNEAWSSFFSLLKLRKEGKLPPHMNRVSPPSYWKDEDGRKLMLAVKGRGESLIVLRGINCIRT